MKKGFTLIELLAVIVILAIIAVIAVPIVLNIINDSKDNSILRSVEFYLDAVDYAIADKVLEYGNIDDGIYSIMNNGNICLETNNVCLNQNTIEVNVDKNKPTGGALEIVNSTVKGYNNIYIDGKIVNKVGNENIIVETGQPLTTIKIKSKNIYNKEKCNPTQYFWAGSYITDATYFSTDYIPVNPGDVIYFDVYLRQLGSWVSEISEEYPNTFIYPNIKFLVTLDENKNVVENLRDIKSGEYIIPEGVSYIVVSVRKEFGTSAFEENDNTQGLMISTQPINHYIEYGADETELIIDAYLPKKINVTTGKKVKLYNNNIVPRSFKDDNITFEWKSNIGKIEEDGLNLDLTSKDKGLYSATLFVYYDGKLVKTLSTIINVVDDELDSNISLLPIGDSLTNVKSWLYHIAVYSENKLSLVGTKSDTYTGGITIGHEGISGARSDWYYSNAVVAGSVANAFYNTEVGHFDLNYYVTQNNINPDGIILFLGTMDIGPVVTENMFKIISEIRNYNQNMPIYLITPTVRGNQGIYTAKFALYLLKKYEQKYVADKNIHVVPLVLTVDSYNSYDDSDDVHPNNNGYIEFANIIYGFISANN